MQFTTILAATGILAAHTFAAPAATSPPLEVTDLSIEKVDPGNVTITFNVYDPDPLTNSSTTCEGTWETGSKGYPTGSYKPCANTTFAWHMESFKTVKSFELGLTHHYTDPEVGDPPYDQITNFAKANIAKPDIACKTTGSNINCAQDEDGVIELPVYATIAK